MPGDKPGLLSTLTSKRAVPVYVGTLLITGMVGYIYLHQSSPGELAKPHAAVAGSSLIMDCKKCHAPAGMNAGCLGCHDEIGRQLSEHRGFHDYLAKAKKTDCGKCHSDHNGPDFALINKASWEGKDPKAFSHPHVQFQLSGAHAKLACDQCHKAKLQPAFALAEFPKMPRPTTFLGLRQACTACHQDPHAGGRITHCTACHDQKAWRPAPYFNHDKFFPLRGEHARLDCRKCHGLTPKASASGPIKVFGPVRGTRCADCHQNPHRTRWAESCETCHLAVDKTWQQADARMTKAQHAETVFKLVSPHQQVTCAKCHAPALPFRQKYPDPRASNYLRGPKDCEGCHRDEHQGQFIGRYPKCIQCHGVQGWKPAKFDRARHQETRYPLVGGHLKAACNACHTVHPAMHIRRYAGTPTACEACHKDIHYGQFRKQGVTHCQDCHRSPARWSLLNFNHETQSRFKLGKAHRNVACKACHPVVSLPSGIRLVQYKPVKTECSDCHGFNVPNE